MYQDFDISSTHLDGVVALGEVPQLLGGLLGDEVGLVLGQSPADGAGLLGAEVEGGRCAGGGGVAIRSSSLIGGAICRPLITPGPGRE